MQTGGGVMSSELRAWAATQPDVGFVDTIHELDGDRDLMVSWVHLRGAANAIVARAFARELSRVARPPSVSRLGRHAGRPEKHSVFPMLDRHEEAQVSLRRSRSRGT